MEPLYPTPSHQTEPRWEVAPKATVNQEMPPLSVGRIASYDGGTGSAPRIIEVHPGPVGEYIENLASKTYELSHALGGSIPYTAIREVTENFIHSGFAEPVISILDGGDTIRFADQGPGISEKEKVRLPGFTSATTEMKRYIRGVGSGLPIVGDFLSLNGGSLSIEDNVSSGTVVTITTRAAVRELHHAPIRQEPVRLSTSIKELSSRQTRILALMVDQGTVGPTIVAKELGISVATAHRDLEFLESRSLIETTADRRRIITDEGFSLLNDGFL